MLRTNFLKTVLASMLVVCTFVFYSCDPDDEEDPYLPGDERNLIGKWDVSNKNAEYTSFEFTEDKNFIITRHVDATRPSWEPRLFIFFDYSITNVKGNKFTLKLEMPGVFFTGFGTPVIDIAGRSATITVGDETYNASKAKNIEATDETKLLCHTWNFRAEDETGVYMTGVVIFTTVGVYSTEDTASSQSKLPAFQNRGVWKFVDSNTINMPLVRLKYWEEFDETRMSFFYENLKILKLTETEFEFELDDEGKLVWLTGTR